ncbi:MAG: metal ABC transporter substrate-binding protein [bacterium]|nr:metal ABC transporter substrate-binding protein [bacterium]
MKRTILPLLAVLAVAVVWHLGAVRELPGKKASSKIKVVASIYPLADIVRQVAGDRAEVVVLLPAGASPHTFEPTPRQVGELGQAVLFVQVGAGLELWADKLVGASGNAYLKRVTAAQGIHLITGEEEHIAGGEHEAHEEHGEHGHGAGHDHGRFGNPHVWLDPVMVSGIVSRIEAALIEADPAGDVYYRERAESYRQELALLDAEIKRETAGFRVREFVSFHSSWPYFARRYGLKQAGVIEESPGREPTPREIREIVTAVKSRGIKAIFAEPQFSPEAAKAIAENTGARILFLDPIGGEGVPGCNNYLDLMRHNLKIMKDAMGAGK